QIVFDPSRQKPLADVLVKPAFGRIALEFFAEAHAESGARGIVGREFTRRQQADVIDFVNTSLGVGVECADAVHFVVEQLDAVRYWAPHRKQIDKAAANAKFARRDDLSDMGIAGETQLLAQGFGRQGGALPEEEGVPGNETGGRQWVQRGGYRDDCNVEGLVSNQIKGGETFRNQVLVRRKTVIG